MLICTIAAVRFDVPPKTSRWLSRTTARSGKWLIRLHKMGMWLRALIAIEVFATDAILDFILAQRDAILMRRRGFRWTLRTSAFARMGGFDVDGQTPWSGMALADMLDRRAQNGKSSSALDAADFEVDIGDRSDTDGLLMTLTVLQITRFLLGIMERVIHALPVSPLELATSNYVLAATVVYAVGACKPRGIKAPILLTAHSGPLSVDMHAGYHRGQHEAASEATENFLDQCKCDVRPP